MGLYYDGLAWAFSKVFGHQQMLHYPMFCERGQSLQEGQRRLSEYCANGLALAGKDLLEVGCGNGEQALYLHGLHRPLSTRGIDLHPPHIRHAKDQARAKGLEGIDFLVDDAQRLDKIRDESVDALLCIESAHHYPDKAAFLNAARRVLRPGGRVVLAELLERKPRRHGILDRRKSTYYWTFEQYRDAFAGAGLELGATEDITRALLDGLATSRDWFAELSSRPAKLAGRFLGGALASYYSHRLRSTRAYWILTGRRP